MPALAPGVETNGFVERLQGAILSALWRIEFRRRFFTGAAAMQTALGRYSGFYNQRRSYQGYRSQGRTPGEIIHSREDKRQRLLSVNIYPVRDELLSPWKSATEVKASAF